MEKTNKKEKFTKVKSLWADFKKFISRGNVVDMAVGVVIGGAFSAIVTSLVNILLSVCTWGVPGGLTGLITILPAVSASQQGINPSLGLDQSFNKSELNTLAEKYAQSLYGTGVDSTTIESVKSTITSNYTLFGDTYAYNQASIINWGSFINAIISFLIIALTLFVILKIYNYLKNKRLAIEKALQEKNKEETKEEETPTVEEKKPTELDLLTEINNELKKLNESKLNNNTKEETKNN